MWDFIIPSNKNCGLDMFQEWDPMPHRIGKDVATRRATWVYDAVFKVWVKTLTAYDHWYRMGE